jgi:hypothetical protein
VTGGYTGTPDMGQRCLVIGDPLADVTASRSLNGEAFAMPALVAVGLPTNTVTGSNRIMAFSAGLEF